MPIMFVELARKLVKVRASWKTKDNNTYNLYKEFMHSFSTEIVSRLGIKKN